MSSSSSFPPYFSTSSSSSSSSPSWWSWSSLATTFLPSPSSLSISPETTSTLLSHTGLALSTLLIGYWIGIGRELFRFRSQIERKKKDQNNQKKRRSKEEVGEGEGEGIEPSQSDSIYSSSSSSLEEEEEDMAISSAVKRGLMRLGSGEECKLVLCVRTDLKMDKGKMAAQCCHATLACYESLQSSHPSLLKQWQRQGQAKVALKCPTETEMDSLEARARALGLCARSIRDAGRTQVAAGSRTVLGIGPGPVRLIDQVTGHLKLL